MKDLRSAMLIGAVVALALGFILVLPGSVTIGSGPFPRWGPSMMGRGMGPGIMGRGGPGEIGSRQAPAPEVATPADTGNGLALPGTGLMLAGGVALVAWWWAGWAPIPRDRRKETPMEVARRRYAHGEISLLEFDQIVQGLLSSEARDPAPTTRRSG